MFTGNQPELAEQVRSAFFVLAMGPGYCGVRTQQCLMWPHTTYNDDDMNRAAAKLLASVCNRLLESAPLELRSQISTDLAAYLSFALGDGLPDETSLSQAVESRRLVSTTER